MPRKPVVQRKYNLHKAECLCLDIQSERTLRRVLFLPRKIPENKLLNRLKATYDTENFKVVQIIKDWTEPVIMIMDEIKFLNEAEQKKETTNV